MNYADLLKKARDEMPSVVSEKERFEIPKVKGHLEGNKTVISNLKKIANAFQRPSDSIYRYLLKELAAPGTMDRGRIIFKAKLAASKINEKIKKYATEYVFCAECGKADTTLIKDGAATFLKCQACGAKYHVKSR